MTARSGAAAEDMVSRSRKKIDLEAVGVACLRQQFSRALRVIPVGLADRFRPLAPWGGIPISGGTIHKRLRYRVRHTPVVGGGELLDVDCLLHRLPDSDVGVPGLLVVRKHDPVAAATHRREQEVGFLRSQGLLLVLIHLVVGQRPAHLVDLPGAQRRDGGRDFRDLEEGDFVSIGQLKTLRREQLVGTPVIGIPHIIEAATGNALSGDPCTGANLSFPISQRAELLGPLRGRRCPGCGHSRAYRAAVRGLVRS